MENTNPLLGGKETKLFDPQNGQAGAGTEVLDATVVKRGDQWWMYLAGQKGGYGATQIFSASLDPGASLSGHKWKLTLDEAGELAPLGEQSASYAWDGNGGGGIRTSSTGLSESTTREPLKNCGVPTR